MNLEKWFITKGIAMWHVCPPVRDDDPAWYMRGRSFRTGREALAAFASGGAR